MSKGQNIRCICINCYSTIDAGADLIGSYQICPECSHKIFIPKTTLKPEDTVGNYEVDKLIGIGGMGEVYHVKSLLDQKDYALKIIRPSIINDEEIEGFKNEIRMNLRVVHNNFIKAFESGTDDKGRLYLVMEFVQGHTLEDQIVQEGRFDEDQALSISLTVAKALQSAWQEWQIIHRDLKPSNILITKANIVKIMDLGVSVNKHENNGETHIIGTPFYMSPEQIETPSEIDQRSDIYSLGATLYELITGTEPYKGRNSDEIFDNVLKVTPKHPAHVRPGVSQATCNLISHFMQKKPKDRPQTWEEAIQMIERALNRYEGEENENFKSYHQPSFAYSMKDDPKALLSIVSVLLLTITIFIVFAYWLVNSQLP